MSKLITLIKSIPFRKIISVYLTGSDNDYYKLYLVGNSEKAVRVDLKRGMKDNFSIWEESSIYNGNKTRKIKPEIAITLLENCQYDGECYAPNKETLDIVLQLLRNPDFKEIQKNKENDTFLSWLVKQDGRDDLIGDLVNDVLRDNELNGYESYDEIYEQISNTVYLSTWDINSFRESKKRGSVNPLLVLKLAKMEYDIFKKQIKLKRFAVRDTSGFVYFFRYENQFSPIKIGRAKKVEYRKKQLQTSLPYDIVTVGYIETADYIELERKIHRVNESKRIKREWFDLNEKEAIKILKEYDGVIISGNHKN